MMGNRQLKWDSCDNVRDLGGMATLDGRKTRWGALVRSDTPSRLTAEGWKDLWAHGIRTIISLRTDGMIEDELNIKNHAPEIEVLSVAIEDIRDAEFVQKWASTNLWGTPLYYQDALRRWPRRHAAVVAAFVHAQPGGVLFHCIRGHDRTGIIAMLLLALVGVSPEDIAADYELSPDLKREELLRTRGTTSRNVIFETLANLDAESYLLSAGLSQSDLEAARKRFLEPFDQDC
jgi:protein tyrosine/serine phosphatase